jgi:hypothetical protein
MHYAKVGAELVGWQSGSRARCLPRKHEVQSSNPSTAIKKLKKKNRIKNYISSFHEMCVYMHMHTCMYEKRFKNYKVLL